MAEGKLAGKVAIVTGAGRGIGAAGARTFASEGARVVLADREVENAQGVVEEIRRSGGDATFVRTEVSRSDEVRSLVEAALAAYGRVDVLYANAGLNILGTAPELAEEDWRYVIDVNLGGQFYLAKYGIPALQRSGGGSIILTASEFGLVGARRSVAYCAAKGGIINMTRALAVDCGRLGIRVNCLTPGPTRTPALLEWFEEQEDPRAFEAAQVEPILLGRLGEPVDLARAAVFLASDDSAFMTGSVLLVDGGVTAWYGI